MSIDTINVTRWLNSKQQFVEVGTLFRDDSLGRAAPLIGFYYNEEYLQNNPGLTPQFKEKSMRGRTLLNDPENMDMVPSYFKQFLPSERNKSVLNALDEDFNKLDQFQQIKHLTKFRGVFGSVQLDYDASQQSNRLPQPVEAMHLLSQLESRNYKSLDSSALSAMYHPNSDNHTVSTYIELGDNHVYCNLKSCATEKEANEYVFIQKMMEKCGIDAAVTVKLEDDSGRFHIGQMTGEQIINKKSGVAAMYNTVPAAVLLADNGCISKFENVNFSHINQAVRSVADISQAEVFKRGVFTHLFAQKDITDRHIKVKEVMDNKWKLAPHEICKINLDANVPFSLALTDTASSYTPIKINDALIDMVASKYRIDVDSINSAITDIANGIEDMNSVAMESGLTPSQLSDLTRYIQTTGINTYLDKEIDKLQDSEGPAL
ncbi:hypothetical protein [Pseudoalteromonas nigrifaciens]|uniref:hypothetical protein n=1 Tax=Pseudoalteromonas nigrifaciens TaxID=28109 RepID=UPI003FD19CE5